MNFLKWLKSLFSKKTPDVQPLPKVNPSKPVLQDSKYADKYVEPKHMKYMDADTGLGEKNPDFVKKKAAKWKRLTGLSGMVTIIGAASAWCALQFTDVFDQAGYSYKKSAVAMAHIGSGQEIFWKKEGLSRGTTVVLSDSQGRCIKNATGGHITVVTGFCKASDLVKPGATFTAKGGNQGDMVKGSVYRADKICYAFWPKEEKLPPPVTKSINCTSGNAGKESTR